jgi:hypothetical protein
MCFFSLFHFSTRSPDHPTMNPADQDDAKDSPLQITDYKALSIIQSKKLRGTTALLLSAPVCFMLVIIVTGAWIYYLEKIDAMAKGHQPTTNPFLFLRLMDEC